MQALFRRYPLRAENLRRNLRERHELEARNRERLAEVRAYMMEWAGFRLGYAAGKGNDTDCTEGDRARSIRTPGDAIRFYLLTAGTPREKARPIRERWRRLYREYRYNYTVDWDQVSHEHRLLVALLVDY